MNMNILVIQGPNLNLLGTREPSIYGSITLQDLHAKMEKEALPIGVFLEFFQSNYEGEIIDKIHEAKDKFNGIIMNAGAYTHYSYAIADAISSIGLPMVEVHISNIYKRETFRHHSVLAPVAVGQISGLGLFGYIAAVHFFADYLKKS